VQREIVQLLADALGAAPEGGLGAGGTGQTQVGHADGARRRALGAGAGIRPAQRGRARRAARRRPVEIPAQLPIRHQQTRNNKQTNKQERTTNKQETNNKQQQTRNKQETNEKQTTNNKKTKPISLTCSRSSSAAPRPPRLPTASRCRTDLHIV
jgi:hypothetical protein